MNLGSTLCIWNPSTGFHKLVEWPPNVTTDTSDDCAVKWRRRYLFHISLYGFGYDSSIDDYLIVLVSHGVSRNAFVTYFSVRTDQWRELIEV